MILLSVQDGDGMPFLFLHLPKVHFTNVVSKQRDKKRGQCVLCAFKYDAIRKAVWYLYLLACFTDCWLADKMIKKCTSHKVQQTNVVKIERLKSNKSSQ